MTEPIFFVCVTPDRLRFASKHATCSKCGIFCFYTVKALDYAKQKYAGREIAFICEPCAAPMMEKQTDAEIRDGQETARAGLPNFLKPIIDRIEPGWVREHFRKRRMQ